MKIDPSTSYNRDPALRPALAQPMADVSAQKAPALENSSFLAGDLQTGAAFLSLGESLESLLAVLSRLSSQEAEMLYQCAREINDQLKTIPGNRNFSAAQIKTMVRIIKLIPFLRRELIRLIDTSSPEGGRSSQRAAMNRLAEQFSRYESLQDLFDEQGVFIFSLPGCREKKKNIEIALHKEGRKRAPGRKRFSLMIDLETAFLGRVTLWAGVRAGSVRVAARVGDKPAQQCLTKGVGRLKKDFARACLDLDNVEVRIRSGRSDNPNDVTREFIA